MRHYLKPPNENSVPMQHEVLVRNKTFATILLYNGVTLTCTHSTNKWINSNQYVSFLRVYLDLRAPMEQLKANKYSLDITRERRRHKLQLICEL